MIKSITFRCNSKKSYINKKVKNKNKYLNKKLVENLLNRKIGFAENKINVLFGPNGSGKTTVLKALGAYCLCGDGSNIDGMTNPLCYSPHNVNIPYSDIKYDFPTYLKEGIITNAGNDADIEWDGYPVYYENIASRRSYAIGDMIGSLCEDIEEELKFTIGSKTSSAGQKTIWMINKLTSIATREIDINEIIEKSKNRTKNVNDLWKGVYEAGINYYKEKIDNCNIEDNKVTILLDELDKSLDITNVIYLYTEVFPKLIQKYNIQIILVSHSPIILSDNIRNNELYNIIPIDKKYYNETLNMLKSIKFES